MNQHPCCGTVILGTRIPQEALLYRYGRSKKDAAGISVKTASYRPPGASFGATRQKSTLKTQGLSVGSAYSQSLLELKGVGR
jgi:hypothetical protein